MSDWDASSGDEAPPKAAAPAARIGNGSSTAVSTIATPPSASVARRKFDDEDADEKVKEDWESSDEEEKAKTAKQASNASSSAGAPTRKKKSVKQKIAEKEEEERNRALRGLTGQDPEDGVDPMEYDPIARKRALQQAEIDADVESAASLLGFATVSEDPATTSFSSAKPSSKEDWEHLALEVFTSILKSQSSRDPTGYAKHFVPALTRQLVSPIRDVDIRKLSASVKIWADERTKADKEAKKSGGRVNLALSASTGSGGTGTVGGSGKPKTVGTASAKNTVDLEAYGDEVLDDGDDLDFM